jgi:hypothetical protein
MPEQLARLGDRTVWGTPNADETGRLIGPSNCRSCVHWTPGMCGIAHNLVLFPDVTDCRAYAREPGSDDE